MGWQKCYIDISNCLLDYSNYICIYTRWNQSRLVLNFVLSNINYHNKNNCEFGL